MHVVALEGLDQGLDHAVRLRAADRREAWDEAESDGEVDRVVSPVAA